MNEIHEAREQNNRSDVEVLAALARAKKKWCTATKLLHIEYGVLCFIDVVLLAERANAFFLIQRGVE